MTCSRANNCPKTKVNQQNIKPANTIKGNDAEVGKMGLASEHGHQSI